MSNCQNKVNILDKWAPSANLSRNSPCGGCLKFNVKFKPLNPEEFVTVSTLMLDEENHLVMNTNFDGTSIFNENGTGYICRSKLIKNNTLYVFINRDTFKFIKELKINDSQCEYNIKINNT